MSNKNDLAAEVLKQAGKSEEEIQRTSEVTRIDSDAVHLYSGNLGRSPASPVHRASWRHVELEEFAACEPAFDARFEKVMLSSIAALKDLRSEGRLYDENGKMSEESVQRLGEAGFWGLRVPVEFGGTDAATVNVMRGITRMSAAGFSTEAGLQSVHGCIGVVGPLRIFGSAKTRELLRDLSTGKRMSAFALTEPGAGSDLSNVKTTARRVGDKYLISGEKVFITNAYYGRTICVVACVEGEADNKSVFVLTLPDKDTDSFRLVRYGLYPLKHCFNHGLLFRDFEVPAENRLTDAKTNGMLAAYHGLNYGRIAVCANGAGGMRQLLRSITPKAWGEYRRTMGDSIQNRELVQERIARAAGLIVACDALRDWAATALDAGYRGELECTIAKVFGSWAQQETAIEIGLLTHGGRGLREGNIVGDNLHDFLAPLIYEGENHMLLMKYFLELFGEQGERFLMPLSRSLKKLQAGSWTALSRKNKFAGVFGLGFHGLRLAAWGAQAVWRSSFPGRRLPEGMDGRLASHIGFALKHARLLALEGTWYMLKHQAAMPNRQCRMIDLSRLSLWTVVMLVTSMHAHALKDSATIEAADVMCRILRRKIKPAHADDSYYAACRRTARLVLEGKFAQLADVAESTIVHPYKQ